MSVKRKPPLPGIKPATSPIPKAEHWHVLHTGLGNVERYAYASEAGAMALVNDYITIAKTLGLRVIAGDHAWRIGPANHPESYDEVSIIKCDNNPCLPILYHTEEGLKHWLKRGRDVVVAR